jgi:hypothetical protein
LRRIVRYNPTAKTVPLTAQYAYQPVGTEPRVSVTTLGMRAIMYEIAETPESQRSTKKKSLFCLAGVLIVLFLVFVVVLLIGAVYHYHY